MTNVRVFGLVRECQIFAGQATSLVGQSRRLLVREFVSRLPAPEVPLEHVVFRGMLLEVALRWSEQLHQHYHVLHQDRCAFDPRHDLLRYWNGNHRGVSPTRLFGDWATAFLDALEHAHAPSPAVRVKAILDGEQGNRVRLQWLARETGCHPTRLRSQFKALFGVSIREYCTRRRVVQAARLLMTSDLKVDAVARAAGFRSRKNFYDAFDRLVGTTPTTVRTWSLLQVESLERRLGDVKVTGGI